MSTVALTTTTTSVVVGAATDTNPFTDSSELPSESQSQSQLHRSSSSNHSLQSPSSSTSSGQIQLHLEESTSEGEETLVTPVEPPNFKVTIADGNANANANKAEVLSPIVEAPEIPKKRLNISKSMQNLRKKKEKGGRERSNSTSDKPPPLPVAPTAIPKSTTPATTGPLKVTRPPLQSNKSGSFSSFLRKLTGKSSESSNISTNTNISNEKNTETVSKRKSMFTPATSINAPKSSVLNEKPRLAKLNTSSRSILKDVASTTKSTPAPTPTTTSAAPTSAPALAPSVLEEKQQETDPINIPLPPSPDIASAPLLPPGGAPPVDLSSPAPAPADVPASAPVFAPSPAPVLAAPVSPVVSSKLAPKQEMHSFEGFEIEPEPEPESPAIAMASPVSTKTTRTGEVSDVDHSFTVDADVDTSTEEADIVKPLAPISIQIPKRNGSPLLPSASTTLSSSSESQIVTPTSAVDPTLAPGAGAGIVNTGRDGRPPAAGVGLGLAELGRKESKWRKSVMGLGALNGSNKRQTQTQTVKPIPTPISTAAATASVPPSHSRSPTSRTPTSRSPTKNRPPSNTYTARSQQNRVSVMPSTQSTAELAAAARGRMARMNSEEEEMAEAFFMA